MVKRFLAASSLCAMLVAMGINDVAAAPLPDAVPRVPLLPDLASPDSSRSGRFQLDSQKALLGYESRLESWSVRVNYAKEINSGFNVDYGTALTERVAVGTNLLIGERHKDLVLNGFYTPTDDVRLQVAGSQSRLVNDYAFSSGSQPGQVQQNNFLVGLKKIWNVSSGLSDVGLTAYNAHAIDDNLTPSRAAPEQGASTATAHALAPGTLEGYRLNLAFIPIARTRIEFGRTINNVTYNFSDGTQMHDRTATNSAQYTHYLDECLQLQGGYDGAVYGDRYHVGVQKQAWNVGLTRTLGKEGNPGDYGVQVRYVVALGASRDRAASCPTGAGMTRATVPLLSEVASRPAQLPAEPLAQVDPTATRSANGARLR